MHRTFRPKGTSVKAVQLTLETADYAADWCAGKKTQDNSPQLDFTEDNLRVMVPTLNGVETAIHGDYIVRVNGQGFRVMKAEEFEDRYEPVRNSPTRSES